MRIFALSGRRRVGKDTVAEILCKNHGFKRFSFADSLKQLCSDALQMPSFYFFDDEYKDSKVIFELLPNHVDAIEQLTGLSGLSREIKLFETPRECLQYVGTNLIRSVDSDFWIRSLITKLKDRMFDVVITDARFSNERIALKAIGATNILIERETGNQDTHESENDLGKECDYDVVIKNNSRVFQLTRDIEMWMTYVRNKQV